jgi:hypothetical protein
MEREEESNTALIYLSRKHHHEVGTKHEKLAKTRKKGKKNQQK